MLNVSHCTGKMSRAPQRCCTRASTALNDLQTFAVRSVRACRSVHNVFICVRCVTVILEVMMKCKQFYATDDGTEGLICSSRRQQPAYGECCAKRRCSSLYGHEEEGAKYRASLKLIPILNDYPANKQRLGDYYQGALHQVFSI